MTIQRSVYHFFLFTVAITSFVIVSGCQNKDYYKDLSGHYYYRASDGRFYAKDNNGVYLPADSQINHNSSTANAALEQKIYAALQADIDTRNQPITVKCMNSQIVLSGYVNNERQRLRAVEIARNEPGVKLVVNTISIKLF